ncbi:MULTISPECIES: NAD(P)H-dependent oxidoreductase [Nonomuraea]|uniref:NAD(P)H-dependent oxidoreductase n=1 Tax=Nonomuraea mangrovi TaxID=2316207 RepID=A0ABW4SPV3_9ACTN
MRLAFIIGGGADGLEVAEWLWHLACPHGFEVDLLDLEVAGLPEVCSSEVPTPPAVRDLLPWLAAADAFVVVRPACFPDSLATWYAPQWRARPAAFAGRDDDQGAAARLRPVFAVTVNEVIRYGRRGSADRVLSLLKREK